MDAINLLPAAALQVALLFLVSKIIINIKFYLRDYLIILGVIIPSVFIYYFFDRAGLIFIVLAMIVFYYFKVKLYSVIIVLLSNLIMYLTNFLAVSFYLTMVNIFPKSQLLVIFHFILFYSIALLLAYFIRTLFKKLKESYLSLNKTYITIISVVLSFSFVFFYIISQTDMSAPNSLRLYAIVFVGLIIFLSIIIFILSMFTLREMRYKRNLQEIETYYEYTLKIESINNEMRKFRHDYVNILSTMSEFIREDDMPGLRQYFNEQIVPMKDNLQTRSLKLNGIEKLKVREIKGLITTKILQAQEKEIAISIEVPDNIERIDMNTIELSRIIGITLDNAIEASEPLDDSLIRIAFFKEEESVTLIIMNKCDDDIPRVHELFEEGFSTKGKSRGLGLSTLKEITDNNENVLLDTVIENSFFVQKIEIIEKES
ncbi:two-component system, LytTR family, sensor histidine kinase AgrC [Staphylococcus pasteuri]|uniref:Two-component system, AgrA family, sensor histidine kinase AgrC n=2 Tax=Staphylococcus TaxID=1279 RepID=A0ABY1H5I2_9STAP|nr:MULTISPECIES: GHKL domain-containing protein [Staphylococcus]ATH62217.1 histidine kinase [Staphylococcus pasteuri]MCF7600643.1 GHKL domain-containing protein [Staphylococcus pasteuri]MDI3232976.1 GHKL domain-containing protein [Staphylococcus pasteuri]MDO6574500.1 GHKL domain-containing protein [Staphylococcus pasteuri_A]MEB6210005.1 GHKL domain-containing protein [Staphylococcus pasteuri]